jgi:hypothetical protein
MSAPSECAAALHMSYFECFSILCIVIVMIDALIYLLNFAKMKDVDEVILESCHVTILERLQRRRGNDDGYGYGNEDDDDDDDDDDYGNGDDYDYDDSEYEEPWDLGKYDDFWSPRRFWSPRYEISPFKDYLELDYERRLICYKFYIFLTSDGREGWNLWEHGRDRHLISSLHLRQRMDRQQFREASVSF